MADSPQAPDTVPDPHESINLKVVSSVGDEIFFKCKMSTPLKKLKRSFCSRKGMAEDRVILYFDGERINDEDTPMDLGMEDGDTIDALDAQFEAAKQAARTGDADALRSYDLETLSLVDIEGSLAHAAAMNGHANCLRVLHELGAAACLSAVDYKRLAPAHFAAENGHVDCLRALHELGAAASLSAVGNHGVTPAHRAAYKGHAVILSVLHELGAAATLLATDRHKNTPAHFAAARNKPDCLRTLHDLGAAASLSAREAVFGHTPAFMAAKSDAALCLRTLHELGAADLSASDGHGKTAAHYAAGTGSSDCLRAVYELGAAASLSATDEDGCTPAHLAAQESHQDCLRTLHELGAAASLSAPDNDGYTPAHYAVPDGTSPVADGTSAAAVLRVLHELGAAASLSAPDNEGCTPAHLAAEHGRANCLRTLHELGAAASLSAADDDDATPITIAAEHGHVECLIVLMELGVLEHDADLTTVMDLSGKRAWLSNALSSVVDAEDDEVKLSLVARRGHILDGLCAQLGVDETTGQLVQGTSARPLDVTFEGERSSGDALRREWFGHATAEMLDPNRGLFLSRDGNRTLQPNPDSASTAGADHLSYFALLGRIAGLALYHQETLNASWTTGFIKAAFGYEITFDDLASADPTVHATQGRLLDMTDDDLAALCLPFVVDSDQEAIVYDESSKRRRSTELKPGGEDKLVTSTNVREYLRLYAEHTLVGSVQPQIAAFRTGLGVFLDAELRAKLRTLCTVSDVQLLLCGASDIDVDDWKASARYDPPTFAASQQAAWFWAYVQEMSAEERSTLLYFCTGSMRPPATGFASLMGYHGAEQAFTLARVHGAAGGRLPTASACFNKMYLPEYATEAELRAKLRLALTGSRGFDERAVAQ